MSQSRIASLTVSLAAICVVGWQSPAAGYTRLQRLTLSASATVGGESPRVTLEVPRLLPWQSVFGKDVLLPCGLQGPAPTIAAIRSMAAAAQLGLSFVYQLSDSYGHPIGGQVRVPMAFQPQPGNPTALNGKIIIPAQSLQSLRQGGTLSYFFQVQSGPVMIDYKNAGVPFQVQFTNTMSFPVNHLGSIVEVPDTNLADGKTTIAFAPGVLAGAGTLKVRQETDVSVPPGPGGLLPIVAYNFELQGTSLQRAAQVTLAYPAQPDGSFSGFSGNPQDLAPYWWQGTEWQVLGASRLDSTLHTVSVATPHFSTFALFLTGASSAADLRPMERILTPNGDGKNDTVDFSRTGVNEIHLFDAKGRRVKTLQPPNMKWDGTDDEGRIVESGVYIYQYMVGGDRISGVILVAK